MLKVVDWVSSWPLGKLNERKRKKTTRKECRLVKSISLDSFEAVARGQAPYSSPVQLQTAGRRVKDKLGSIVLARYQVEESSLGQLLTTRKNEKERN